MATCLTSTLHLESNGGSFSSIGPTLRKLWQFKNVKLVRFYFQMFNFQKMSGTERVKKEQSFFSHKEAKMSFLCYFQAKKVISMKNKIHDQFMSPYKPRTIHIYGLPRWKIQHINMT